MFAQHNQTTATHRHHLTKAVKTGKAPPTHQGQEEQTTDRPEAPHTHPILYEVQHTHEEQTKRVFLYVVLLPDN